MIRRRFDAVFVDFYGTLVTGDRQAVERTCARFVRDHSLSLTAARVATMWGHAFFGEIERANGEAFKDLYTCECDALLTAFGARVGAFDPQPYADMLKDYWCDPPIADGALDGLRAIDVPVYVVSNADTSDVRAAIDRRGFEVTGVITSQDARSYKPDAGIFETALARAGVAADRVMHVGDSLHSDVAGAQALGLTACWICYEDRILDIGDAVPCHKIRSIMQLQPIVAGAEPRDALTG